LWSQGGSKVIRGNLLVIPIEDTLLYVEPLYIESSNRTSLPEVKRIIVSYGDKIVMQSTLDESLDALIDLLESEESSNEKIDVQDDGDENTEADEEKNEEEDQAENKEDNQEQE